MAKSKPGAATQLRSRPTAATHAEVSRICGELLDWKVAAILAAGATVQELEEAAAWAAGESDIMGKERKQLTGRIAEIWDILSADEEPDDEGNAAPAAL